MIRLADRLKARRLERGISQSQAARELEVARTAYRLWEMEAARPSQDRWRLVARWLGVPMTTLLVAEGLLSEEEQTASDQAEQRLQASTSAHPDGTVPSEKDFFVQARSMIDRGIEEDVVTAAEAGQLREMFERIERRTRER